MRKLISVPLHTVAAVETTPKAVNTTGDFTVRCTGTPPDGDFLKFDWPQGNYCVSLAKLARDTIYPIVLSP